MSLTVVLLLIACIWLLPGICALCFGRERRRGRGLAGVFSRERTQIEMRSSELLRDVLNEHEYQQLTQQGYVDVASHIHEGRLYRIPRYEGRILVYEDGRVKSELCIQPVTPLPANDVVALHKLMIEGNEQGYLARANEFPIALPPRFNDHQTWPFIAL